VERQHGEVLQWKFRGRLREATDRYVILRFAGPNRLFFANLGKSSKIRAVVFSNLFSTNDELAGAHRSGNSLRYWQKLNCWLQR
jgi:hypothetical protein